MSEKRKIKGIAYWDGESLVMTESRPMISELDKIPLPARDLLEIGKHSYIFSSRGCPYRCTFCASSRYWDKVRLFSAGYVVREIKELHHKYGVNLISFFDDLFIINKQRLVEITNLLKKEKLLGKIKFTCSCRSNLVNEEVVKIMKEMGVVSVGMGLESGSKRILNYLKGESTSIGHNKQAVELLKKYGISANASFVIGSPDETEAEMMETYDFIKQSKLDLIDTYILMPLPGTPVWEYAKKMGLVSDNMELSRLNVNFAINHNPVIVSELYNKDQLLNIYKRFARLRLFMNIKNVWHSPFLLDVPRYIAKILYERIVFFLKKITVPKE